LGKANLSRKEEGQMYFHEAEIVELGLAEELIQDELDQVDSESSDPNRIKTLLAVYVADAE
jgi:hypothetical protein